MSHTCAYLLFVLSTFVKINRCLPDSLSPARCQLADWSARVVSSHLTQNGILHFAQVKTNVTNKPVKSYERYNIQTFTLKSRFVCYYVLGVDQRRASPLADLRSVPQLNSDTLLDEMPHVCDPRSASKPETGRDHSGYSDFSFVLAMSQRLY